MEEIGWALAHRSHPVGQGPPYELQPTLRTFPLRPHRVESQDESRALMGWALAHRPHPVGQGPPYELQPTLRTFPLRPHRVESQDESRALMGWALAHRSHPVGQGPPYESSAASLSIWAPCGAAEGGRKGPKGRREGSRRFRCGTGCAVSGTRPPVANLRAAEAPHPGCPFSWLLLFGQAKRSDSLARDGERKNTGT